MTESETTFTPISNDGYQRRFKFANGYGASVVRGEYTCGGKDGLYELAVLGKDGHLTYDTPIGQHVIGYLDDDAVAKHLAAIAALPAVTA